MHFLDDNGAVFESPEEEFIKLLEIGLVNANQSKETLERINTTLSGEDKVLTAEDLRFIGCVVTGTKAELSELVGADWISASSIGVVLP